MTNGDSVRLWTDEQIAEFVARLTKRCAGGILKESGLEDDLPDELYKAVYDEYLAWLRQEIEPTEQAATAQKKWQALRSIFGRR